MSNDDTTTKMSFLEVCMGIEGLCADIYHQYSKIYEDIPEAFRLWKKTALEEENHQHQFKLALRLLGEAEFEISDENFDQAYAIQNKLLKIRTYLKDNKPELSTAVSQAVEMEGDLANLHVHTSLHYKDESVQKLFKALSAADHDHVEALERYRAILYLPHSEMENVT